MQAIWVKQSAQQKAVEQLCAAAAAGDTAAMEAALAAQPGLLSEKIFNVQTGVRWCRAVCCSGRLCWGGGCLHVDQSWGAGVPCLAGKRPQTLGISNRNSEDLVLCPCTCIPSKPLLVCLLRLTLISFACCVQPSLIAFACCVQPSLIAFDCCF